MLASVLAPSARVGPECSAGANLQMGNCHFPTAARRWSVLPSKSLIGSRCYHAAKLSVVLLRDAHHLAELLLGAVPGRVSRPFGLPSVTPHDGANQPSDQVVFEEGMLPGEMMYSSSAIFLPSYLIISLPLIAIGVALLYRSRSLRNFSNKLSQDC